MNLDNQIKQGPWLVEEFENTSKLPTKYWLQLNCPLSLKIIVRNSLDAKEKNRLSQKKLFSPIKKCTKTALIGFCY